MDKIVDFFKKRPGLVIILVILGVITANNIKPDFYLAGWDNYSSYFNLKTNIFRTFFATWREYRGLGVPSDAEVTDIFRQMFDWVASFILPEQLLDQAYYLISLWIGILGMYGLSKILFKKSDRNEFIATVAALFYLFNLNTLSIFYSPIIPFTNRFYSLPLLIYLFLRYLDQKNGRNLFYLLITVFFASGSYITPTIIITSIIGLFIFLFFHLDFKKTFIYITIYVLLNAFWMLPFFNYVIQKSPLVPQARTFIEINESTLNRSPSTFSLSKQATLYPSFLDISFSSQNNQGFAIHPQLNEYVKSPIRFVLWAFPLLYGLGSILIIKEWKKEKRLLWIPLWISVFLFLSMKEFGLFGFIYAWLAKNIPFFDVIFRISDTKFHAYISFAGSIAASYAIMNLFQHKKFISKGLIAIGLVYIFLFRSYFNGNLIGFFAYTKIPDAYFEIAKIINKNPEKDRVLHLPIDQWQHYWRSFSWGYLGSAFFNFFIDKPYIDKTFEPASMENAYLHSRLNILLDRFYRTTDESQKNEFADEFAKLLQQLGIRYIIVDQSISADVYPRNLVYTARQSYVKAKAMMEYITNKNQSVLVHDYPINLAELYPYYKALYPANKVGLQENLPEQANLYLYQMNSIQPAFVSGSMVKNIDPAVKNLFETDIPSTVNSIVAQDTTRPAMFMPFAEQDNKVSKDGDVFTLEYKNANGPARYVVSTSDSSQNSYMIDVFANIQNNKLNLTFYNRYYPDINGQQFRQPVGNASFDLNLVKDDYRLKLNDVFVAVPTEIRQENAYVASYLVHEKSLKVSLLTKSGEVNLPFGSFTKTNPSSCYGPEKNGYSENFLSSKNNLHLESKSGSICGETQIIMPNDLEDHYVEFLIQASGSSLKDIPVQGYVCVSQSGFPGCLNFNRHLRLSNSPTYYGLTFNAYLNSLSLPKIQIGSIPQQNQNQTIEINRVTEYVFTPVTEKEMSFDPVSPRETVTVDGPLKISFPEALSPYSYSHDPNLELFDLSQNDCRSGKPRNMYYKDNMLFNEMENCDVYFAQRFNYAFGHPYLFAYEYELDGGQQPNILLGREGDNYLLEKASLYQGYPNLKDRLVYASRLLEPGAFSDTFSKDMSIHLTQDTANKGILGIRAFDMVEYPDAWYRLTLDPAGSEKIYSNTGSVDYKQILPSLWSIKLDNIDSDNLVVFNEGYDKQWGVYDNFFDLLFGKSQTRSIRCNGYANCFELKPGDYYIFFWPERLYFLGWFLTIATVIFCLKALKSDPLKTE